MAKKKAAHGGKREGSGRKPVNPEGRTVVIGASVPVALLGSLDAIAEANGWNRSQAVTEAIRGLVARKKR